MIVVTAKETRLLLRSHSAYVFLMLALLVVGGAFAMFWLSGVSSGNMAPSERTALGRAAFSLISGFQLAAMGLISPLMAATAVTVERENKTLDLLLSTGLSRLRLLLGKWLATVAYQLVLLICLLPVLALVFQLGGVGLDEYLFAAVTIAITVLTYSMAGLACSCLFRRSIASLVATLALVLFLSVGLPLTLGLLDDLHIIDINTGLISASTPFGLGEVLFFCVSPLTVWISHAMELQSTSAPGAPATTLFGTAFCYHLFFQALIFCLSLLVAWRAFGRREHGRVRVAKRVIDDPAELARRRRRFPYYLIDPLRRAQAIGDRQNPVLVKEQRVGTLAKPHVLIRLGYLCLPLSVFLIDPFANGDQRTILQAGGTYALTLIMLIVPIFAATALSREREEKTYDLLRTTPLTSAQIVRAKFLVTLRLAAVITAGLLLFPLVVKFFDIIFSTQDSAFSLAMRQRMVSGFAGPSLQLLLLIFAFSTLYVAIGLFFSAGRRRNIAAMLLTYLALILLTYLPPLIYGIADDLGLNDNSRNLFIPLAKALLAYVAPLLSHTYYLFWDSESSRHAFVAWHNQYYDTSFYQAGAWAKSLLHTALVLGLAYFFLWRASRRLEKERA